VGEDRQQCDRGRIGVALALLLACAAALAPAAGAAPSKATGFRLFAASSVWNVGVRTATVDRSSARRMGALVTSIKQEVSSGTGPWISEASYSTPLYVVGKAQRRTAV
jgi:hypothetical protein